LVRLDSYSELPGFRIAGDNTVCTKNLGVSHKLFAPNRSPPGVQELGKEQALMT
jgi:hypothetical protein